LLLGGLGGQTQTQTKTQDSNRGTHDMTPQ
jgi:hypothetical protein